MSLPAFDLRDPQLSETLSERSLVLSAGAGSGKTFTLVSLVLVHLGRGGRASRIVATTFGRDAAADMKSRILRPLDQLAAWDLEIWRAALSAMKSGPEAWNEWFDNFRTDLRREILEASRLWSRGEVWPAWTLSPEAARAHWVRARREAELLKASTVHALALEILRSRGTGLDQLVEAEDPALLGLLRTAGRAALDLSEGNLDRCAARRLLAWCEGKEGDHLRWEILAAAFDGHQDALGTWRADTETAAIRESLFRVGQKLMDAYAGFMSNPLSAASLTKKGEPYANFMKSGLQRLLEEPADGSDPDALLEALERMATSFLKTEDGEFPNYYSDSFIHALEPLREEIPALLETWMTLLLERVFLVFRDLKAQRGLQSYGDLVREALASIASKSLEDAPDLLLVDEYQDINPVQQAFLDALGAKRVVRVGDPKQAIYGFRGGVPDLLKERLRKAAERGEAFRLPANHRSAAPIVELSNAYVEHVVPALDPLAKDADGVQEHRGRGSGTRRVALAEFVSTKQGGSDLPATFPWVGALAREEGWRAVGFHSGGTGHRRALLLSRRTGLATLRRLLQGAGIEPLVQSREGFWESPGVRLMMALFEAVARPESASAQLAVLRSPCVGATVPELFMHTEDSTNTVSKIVEALEWIHDLRALDTQSIAAAALSRTGLLELLASTDVHGSLEPARARRNLDHFLGWIPGLPANPALAWNDLSLARKAGDPGDAPAEDEAADLVIQTIHGAKGLEYDDVMLPMLADQVKGIRKGTVRQRRGGGRELWMGWKLGKARGPALKDLDAEEKARSFREGLNLLYVGLTRAKERLALLQMLPMGKDGEVKNPGSAIDLTQKSGFTVRWNNIAVDMCKVVPGLEILSEPPAISKIPPTGKALPFRPLERQGRKPAIAPGEAGSGNEDRIRKGIQIHALLREVLVRDASDPASAALYLERHPLTRAWPACIPMVEGVLRELRARNWQKLPRRTEFEIHGRLKNVSLGRADLVIWEPTRHMPSRIHLVDFKLSSEFPEDILLLHREQLARYRSGLLEQQPQSAVTVWLVALERGTWVPLEMESS